MTEAKNVPVRRGRPPTIHSADIPEAQAPGDVSLSLDTPLERGESIIALDKPLTDEYAKALAMAEDSITILIEPGTEENAPRGIDLWVNGKGAEVMDPANGQWVELRFLPVGGPIVTKRKYVEVLARSKTETVRTKHGSQNEENPENTLMRTTARRAMFSVLEDKNPMGRAWLTRLMSDR